MPSFPGTLQILGLRTKDPDTEEVEFLIATALPFGTSAAVHGFNRAAMALDCLAHQYIGIPCTHYFDDFALVMPDFLGAAADIATKQFFELLGWEVKSAKDKPMKQEFTALGVVYDLPKTLDEDPMIIVKNKKEGSGKIVTHGAGDKIVDVYNAAKNAVGDVIVNPGSTPVTGIKK